MFLKRIPELCCQFDRLCHIFSCFSDKSLCDLSRFSFDWMKNWLHLCRIFLVTPKTKAFPHQSDIFPVSLTNVDTFKQRYTEWKANWCQWALRLSYHLSFKLKCIHGVWLSSKCILNLKTVNTICFYTYMAIF